MSIHETSHDAKLELTMPARPPGNRWQRILVRYTGAFLAGSALFLLTVAFVLQETGDPELVLGTATIPLLAAAHSLGLLVFLRTLDGWGWWKAAALAVGAGALALATTYLLEMLLPMLLGAGFSFGFGGGDNDNDSDNGSGADDGGGSSTSGHSSRWQGVFGGIEGGGSSGESATARGQHQQCPGCGRPTAGGACPSCRW